MGDKRFDIKCRIFKRERVRENKTSLVIVPKTEENSKKNQIELSWDNQYLQVSHLSIVGRVMIREWERVLGKYPITRSFMHFKEDNQVRLYLSFTVADDLDSREIKEIISKATDVLTECLAKVEDRVIKENGLEDLVEPQPVVEESKIGREITIENDDEVIKKLQQEIDKQESLLKELAKRQKEEVSSISVEEIEVPQVSSDNILELKKEFAEKQVEKDAYFTLKLSEKEASIHKLTQEVTSLSTQVEKLSEQLTTSDLMNRELDKANLKLSETIKQNKLELKKLDEVNLLEVKIKELMKENSDLRVHLTESQSLVEQYRHNNDRLTESVERLETSQTELLQNAQVDYDHLDQTLKDSEKKLILEVNERQKLEIQLETLRKKIAEVELQNEEKEKKIKSLGLDLSNQLELREDELKEIDELTDQVDKLKADLQMAKATNDVLKDQIEGYESEKEKWQKIGDWQIKYEDIERKYTELEREAYVYRQEVNLLNSQLGTLQNKLTTVSEAEAEPIFTYKTLNTTNETVTYQPLDEINQDLDIGYDDDYEYEYFSYEEDPYVEEVITEELMNIRKKDQSKEEQQIKELLENYYEDSFKDIKVGRDEYRQYILDFKFLSFRWSQVFIMDESDKNTAFLEWCAPYIDKIEDFEEELSFDVKKSFFMKNYVTMDESTYHILKGYSKLSNYLDTYYLKVSYYIDKYFLNEGNR